MYKKYQAYCEHCWKEVDYYLENCIESFKKFGKTYEYPAKKVYCIHCNQEAALLSLHDHNILSLSQKYREDHNLLGYSEIREITSIYNISVSSLEKISTSLKYFKNIYFGQEPRPKKSQELYKLRYDPQYFLEILEANKSKISPISYEKAKFAVQFRLSDSLQSKLHYACLYFAHRKGAINKFVLQDLLFYTQGFSRVIFGYHLFAEECFTCEHGPVFKEVDAGLKDQNIETDYLRVSYFSTELPDNFSDVFLDEELELLETITECFAKFTHEELLQFIQSEKYWLAGNTTESQLFSKENFYEYFLYLKIVHGIFSNYDIPNYVEYLVAKNQGQAPQTGLVADPNKPKE